METFQAERVIRENTHTIQASCSQIFPLLCPVREHEWIDGWSCQMVYSASGVAENNCIFKTSFPRGPEEIWTVSHYDPKGSAIQFVIVNPLQYVMKLDISLQKRGENSTDISWTNTFTGLTEEGNAFIANHTGDAYTAGMARLFNALEYFLNTGKMLRAGSEPGQSHSIPHGD
jgi:hypothetical protein